MLETLTDPKFYIKDLSIEEPINREFSFDDLVLESDLQPTFNLLNKLGSETNWELFSSSALHLKILQPGLFENFSIKNDQWKKINLSINDNWASKMAYELKLLDPKGFRGHVRLDANAIDNLYRHIQSIKRFPLITNQTASQFPAPVVLSEMGNREAILEKLLIAKVVCPTRELNQILTELEPKLEDSIKLDLLELVNEDQSDDYSLRNFMIQLGQFRLLYPENDIQPPGGQKIWSKIKTTAREFRAREARYPLVELLANSKLLAAEKIDITYDGLEIVMPNPHKPFQKSSQPLPERRKF